ncbi:LysR family transcriptional regulator [Roseibium sp.]|uniref:LysR family transcriptional regulator n=1 Tax=Roseibium sp. TaxID=1936156 RepID=UPI003BABFE85
MNLSQLSAFRAVMTSATLTDAAAKLRRTQPAVSAAIKSLEDQIGMRLFERRGRNLVPVPEAQYLLTEAEAILGQLSRVSTTMRALATGETGSLTVAAMPGPSVMLFPRFVAEHMSEHSDGKITMFARSSHQIMELTRAQSIDFGFADVLETPDVEELYTTDIISADCFVALHVDHPLALTDVITLKDLDAVPLGTLPTNHRHTQNLAAALKREGCTCNIKVECQTFLSVLQFVITKRCVTILDPLMVVHCNESHAWQDTIVVRPLASPVRYQYAVYTPRHRPESLFAETARHAWAAEVERMLSEIGSAPKWETQSGETVLT